LAAFLSPEAPFFLVDQAQFFVQPVDKADAVIVFCLNPSIGLDAVLIVLLPGYSP